jgi:hypothetical protein
MKKIASITFIFLITLQSFLFFYLISHLGDEFIRFVENLAYERHTAYNKYTGDPEYSREIKNKTLDFLLDCPCSTNDASIHFWLVIISFILFAIYYKTCNRNKKANKFFFWYFIIHGIWKILLLMFFCPSNNFTF